jgi:hypothetical protein
MKRILFLVVLVGLFQFLFSCKTRVSEEEELKTVVSVSVVQLIKGDIENELSLNGSSVYLKKNTIVSPIAGYVTKVNVIYGQNVRPNQSLFEVQTRERRALQGVNDPAADFGNIAVNSPSEGIIDEINVSDAGIYIPEGAALCSILSNNDLMIKVNVPFENNKLVTIGKKCTIILPDKTELSGIVSMILPIVDDVNQTQTILIKPQTTRQLPKNLNMIIRLSDEKHTSAFLVPKSSLMANETQDEFWIMRVENDTMAVKIPVIRGIEKDSIVEIISQKLNINDRIVSEGAYGLSDSTVIEIVK